MIVNRTCCLSRSDKGSSGRKARLQIWLPRVGSKFHSTGISWACHGKLRTERTELLADHALPGERSAGPVPIPVDNISSIGNQAGIHRHGGGYCRSTESAGAPPLPTMGSVDTATLQLLAAWTAEDATTDPEKLREADEQIAEFKNAMNENRAATGARRVFS